MFSMSCVRLLLCFVFELSLLEVFLLMISLAISSQPSSSPFMEFGPFLFQHEDLNCVFIYAVLI